MPAKRAELTYFMLAGVCLGLAALLAIALQKAGVSSRQAGILSLIVGLLLCAFVVPRIIRFIHRRTRESAAASAETPAAPTADSSVSAP
jgi:predicted lipid-binding transport protein (Tim44 family)